MKRVFCTVGGGFLSGAFIASFLGQEKQVIAAIAGLIIGAIILLCYRGGLRMTLAAVCFFAGAGALLFWTETVQVYQPVSAMSGERALVSGTIVDWKETSSGKYGYEVQTDSVSLLDNDKQQTTENFRLLLYTDTKLEAEYYDKITASLRFFERESNEMFDSERYYSGQGIYLTAYAAEEQIELLPTEKKPLFYHLRRFNRFLREKLDENLSPHSAALLKGMILGDRSDIDETTKQAYQLTGTIHLLSISGMHVTLLAGFLAFLFLRFRRWGRVSIVIQALGIIGFLLLSGTYLSAIRSGMMVLIMLAGKLFRRPADSLNSLFAAGFFIVLSDVYAIMDIGFCMSFLATLGILTAAPRWASFGKRYVSSWLGQKTIELLAVSLSANLFLLPIYIFQFGTVSIISPIVNIPVNITSGIILILGFPLTALGFLPIPSIFYLAEEMLIFIQDYIISFFAKMKYASIGVNFDSIRLWFLFSVCLFVIGFLWRKKGLLRISAAFSGVLFLVSLSVAAWEAYSSVQIHVIGDGSTANVLFLYGNHATVISSSDDDYIDKLTLNYLRSKNIAQLDNVIFTYESFHEYRDSLILLKGLPPQNVFYPQEGAAFDMILKEETSANLLKISPELQKISVNGNLTFQTGFYQGGIFLEVSCYGSQIFLGTGAACAERAGKDDLIFIRGRLRKAPELTQGIPAVLLQSPYTEEAQKNLLCGYSSQLRYDVRPGQALKSRKKMFSLTD